MWGGGGGIEGILLMFYFFGSIELLTFGADMDFPLSVYFITSYFNYIYTCFMCAVKSIEFETFFRRLHINSY